MPLSEFLRMAKNKLQAAQQRPSMLDPSSSRVNNDLFELVWENGQIMMQGQSSRASRTPDNLQSTNLRFRDSGTGNANNSRIGKFDGVESMLEDMSPIVPSGALDLSQDDDMGPWLAYPVDNALQQEYFSEILPEISGVTANGMSAQSNLLSSEKRNNCDQIVSNFRGDANNGLKITSPKPLLPSPWMPQRGQISDPSLGSGVSGVFSNKHPMCDNSGPVRDIYVDPTNRKTERQNIRVPSNNSNLLNFSCFSRPATIVKPSIVCSDGIPTSVGLNLKRMEVEENVAASSCNNRIKEKAVHVVAPSTVCEPVTSRAPATKLTDSFHAGKNGNIFQRTSLENEKSIIVSNTDIATKGTGERAPEPVVASSSVGSDNGGDRDCYDLKRKFCDIEEPECHSHDIETESADGKKVIAARGGTGAKRSRAAEVHNLSERRRRDRINEKMRALQELIPNCNKADKASMLDEAIEYLKTLQLQVQIMSMGTGLCMPPMMFPPGIQHMHPAHAPHFSAMGLGMGMGMGFGMGMVDMNGGSPGCHILPVPSMQGPQFPSPMNFPAANLQLYGHGLPNSLPRPPLVPLTAQPSITSAMSLSPSKTMSQNEVHGTSLVLNSEDSLSNKNSQILHNPEAGSSINATSTQVQATNEALDRSATGEENKQSADVAPAPVSSVIATDISSKERG